MARPLTSSLAQDYPGGLGEADPYIGLVPNTWVFTGRMGHNRKFLASHGLNMLTPEYFRYGTDHNPLPA